MRPTTGAPRGMGTLGSAELWRQQTDFGAASDYAKRAESVFAAYGDTYGSAEAMRMQGFCQRLAVTSRKQSRCSSAPMSWPK